MYMYMCICAYICKTLRSIPNLQTKKTRKNCEHVFNKYYTKLTMKRSHNPKTILLTLLLLNLTTPANAIQCSSDPLLQKYRIDKTSILSEIERDTPPSTTKEIWWFNPCEHENTDSSQQRQQQRPELCDPDSILCGLTEVKLPDMDSSLVTQIINFSKNLAYSVDEVNKNLVITLKECQWGSNLVDAQWEFLCDTNLKMDELVSNTWQDRVLKFQVRGPSGCLKTSEENHKLPRTNKGGNGSGNGFFSFLFWLMFYAVVFALIYIGVLSFMNTRGGTFDDFRLEFVERLTQFVTSLPGFVREIVVRILGRTDSSAQRGGYSAV